jgi:hypothetical protein
MSINVQELTVPVFESVSVPAVEKLQGTAVTIPQAPVPPSIATPPKFVTLSDVAKAAQTAMAQSEQELKVKLESLNAPISVEDLIKAQYQQQANTDLLIKTRQELGPYISNQSSVLKAIKDQFLPVNGADQSLKPGDVVLAKLWKASQDYASKQATGLTMEPSLITGSPVGADSFGMPSFPSGATKSSSVPVGSTSINAAMPVLPPHIPF